MGQQLLRGQFRGEAPVRYLGGDGAAGADQQDFLHTGHPKSR